MIKKLFLLLLFLPIKIVAQNSAVTADDVNFVRNLSTIFENNLADVERYEVNDPVDDNKIGNKEKLKWMKENDINSICSFCNQKLFLVYGTYVMGDEPASIYNEKAEEVFDILKYAADKGNPACQFMLGCVLSENKTIRQLNSNNEWDVIKHDESYKYLNDKEAVRYFNMYIENPNRDTGNKPFGYSFEDCMTLINNAYPKLSTKNKIYSAGENDFDVIFKKDGTEIEAKIINVSKNEISYKKISNLDGPSYILSVNEVFMIKYKNGEKDIFDISKHENTSSNEVSTSFSVEGKQQIVANNIDFLRRDDLLRQSRIYKGWGKGLFWTILIGGTAGGILAGATEWSTGAAIGYYCGVGVVSILPMATLYSKGVRLKNEAMSINIANIGGFSIGNSNVQSNLTMIKVPAIVSPAIGVGFNCRF